MMTKDDARQLAALVRENMAALGAEWQAAHAAGVQAERTPAQCEQFLQAYADALDADGFAHTGGRHLHLFSQTAPVQPPARTVRGRAGNARQPVVAARLMGAHCILSGIRPQIAQTIVHLGIDLDTVVTKATLADAFLAALGQTGPVA